MPPPVGEHVILFDGECGLCDRLVRFVVRRDPDARFQFASLRGVMGRAALERFGKLPGPVDTFHVIASHRSSPALLCRGRAMIFVLERLPRPWRWLRILSWLPERLVDAAYDLVARNRYLLWRRREACDLPTPEARSRFLDP